MSASSTTRDTSSTADRSAKMVRVSALAGIAGPVLFTLTFLAQESFRREEYDPIAEPVSALAAGPNGWVQHVNFVVFGLLLLTFALGLHGGLAPARWGILGPALLGLASIGVLLAAAFPLREDAAGVTYDPGGHFISGVMFFFGSSLAMLITARRLAQDPRMRGVATYTAVCGVLALVGVVVFVRLVLPDSAPLHDYAGLVQRMILLLVTFPCLVTLALRLRRVTHP